MAARVAQFMRGTDPISLEEFPVRYADAYCAALEACDAPADMAARFPGAIPSDACRVTSERFFRSRTMAGMTSALERSTLEYNAAFAEDCLENFRELGCGAFDASLFEICANTFVGQSDEECLVEYECGPSQRCERGNGCAGTCVNKSESGQPCRASGECISGHYCSEENNVCLPVKKVGERCATSDGNLQCSEGSFCSDGKCSPIDSRYSRTLGQSCGQEGLCEQGLSCAAAPQGNQCLARSGKGQKCWSATPSQCPVGTFCTAAPNQGEWEGTCEAKLAAGTPCSGDDHCDAQLECLGGLCRQRREIGATCQEDYDCLSSHCLDRECTEQILCQN